MINGCYISLKKTKPVVSKKEAIRSNINIGDNANILTPDIFMK